MSISPLKYTVAPLSTSQSGPHPTLILLHGRGTDEHDLLGLSPFFDPRLLVVSIRAPIEFPYGGYTWFDLDENGSANIDQVLENSKKFFDWLNDFRHRYPVHPDHIFLFGFSMGAMMSLILSLSSPTEFQGIIAHSGFLFEHERLGYQWSNTTHLSYYLAHGIQDPIVPVALGRQSYQRLKQERVKVVYHEYPIPHTISDESLQDASLWLQAQL